MGSVGPDLRSSFTNLIFGLEISVPFIYAGWKSEPACKICWVTWVGSNGTCGLNLNLAHLFTIVFGWKLVRFLQDWKYGLKWVRFGSDCLLIGIGSDRKFCCLHVRICLVKDGFRSGSMHGIYWMVPDLSQIDNTRLGTSSNSGLVSCAVSQLVSFKL